MQGKKKQKQKQKRKILKSPYTKHIACFTSRKFLAFESETIFTYSEIIAWKSQSGGSGGGAAEPPSLYQDECPPLARGQVLHLTVPLRQPSRITAWGQPGEALWQGPSGEGHWASADVQVCIQELSSGCHRGHASLEEGCWQQWNSRHEKAITGSEHVGDGGQLGGLLVVR